MKINCKMIAFSADPEWAEGTLDVPSAGPTDVQERLHFSPPIPFSFREWLKLGASQLLHLFLLHFVAIFDPQVGRGASRDFHTLPRSIPLWRKPPE